MIHLVLLFVVFALISGLLTFRFEFWSVCKRLRSYIRGRRRDWPRPGEVVFVTGGKRELENTSLRMCPVEPSTKLTVVRWEAESIVVTSWPVHGESHRKMMSTFYDLLTWTERGGRRAHQDPLEESFFRVVPGMVSRTPDAASMYQGRRRK